MILGMSTAAFTYLHVALSLIGIGAGLVALVGMGFNKFYRLINGLFLLTTVLTSLTGFLYPFKGVTPGIILGILSMVVLLLAIGALYGQSLAGSWRGTYVISAGIAQWFNVFVLFAQLFQKVPALKAIAPTQASPIFGITQVVVLVVSIAITVRAFRRFKSV